MFRFNNPDALLVPLMTPAAYATRPFPGARPGRWLVLVGAFAGFAFLTKMMHGLLVVTAFAIAHVVVAPTTRPTRILHLIGAGAAMFAATGWWVTWSHCSGFGSALHRRLAGTSILKLAFGDNGIGRPTGSVGTGVVTLGQARHDLAARAVLAVVVAVGAGWTFERLGRSD